MTAFDNRGAGRTRMPDGRATVTTLADDAAGVLERLGVRSAHVAGFSGGSIITQELALRRPDLVRSLVLQSTWGELDAYLRRWATFVRRLVGCRAERAGLPRGLLPGDLHPAGAQRRHGRRDHRGGAGVPLQAVPRGHPADLDVFLVHQTIDRLHRITAPTLVLAGGIDATAHPALGRAVADAIPGALFEVEETESHEPFQEVPDRWNARVDAFWQDVERPAPVAPRPRESLAR